MPYDEPTTIYLQTEATSAVIRYTGSVTYSAQELFSDVTDFEVVDKFMFVTRNVVSSSECLCIWFVVAMEALNIYVDTRALFIFIVCQYLDC